MRLLATVLLAGIILASVQAARAQEAADLFKSKCQVCHGADGKGDTPAGKKLGARDFHAPEVIKMSDAELIEVTKKGKDKMPSYDKKLTDDQIRQLVKYIRTIK